jgi:uncharacterized repeat protein (TIGR02543 family)
MTPRRILTAVLVTTVVTGGLILGVPATADAATVTVTTADGVQYQADDSNAPGGAAVVGYSGNGGAVVIPATIMINGVSYPVTSIGDDAFDVFNMFLNHPEPSLTSLVLPDSVTTIGDRAFWGNQSLTSVKFGSGLTYIGDHAFTQDPLGTLVLPPHVTEILGNVFAGDSLTSVTLDNALTFIHGNAFISNNLTSVTIPASVDEIDSTAFYGNPGLTSVFFAGPAPAVINPAGNLPSLGATVGLVVSYLWADDAARSAGGFTTPTWQGYSTRELVTTTFDANGYGTAPAAERFAIGGTATQPPAPTATGKAFTGWYTTPALTTKVDFADPVTADQTLYAGWASLAETGVDIAPWIIPSAFGALLIGLALALIGRRRSSRSTRAAG